MTDAFRARAAALLTTFLVAVGLVVGAPTAAHAGPAEDLVAMLNAERAAAGLGPLRLNGEMSAVAAGWSQQLANAGSLSHNPSFSTQIPAGWSAAAENVAMNSPADVAGLHRAWMASPGHRVNILGPYTDVGIAVVVQNGAAWATQVFAAYGAPPAPAPAPAPAPVPAPAPAPAPPPAPAPAPAPAPVPEPEPVPEVAATPVPTEATPSPTTAAEPSDDPRAQQRAASRSSDRIPPAGDEGLSADALPDAATQAGAAPGTSPLAVTGAVALLAATLLGGLVVRRRFLTRRGAGAE